MPKPHASFGVVNLGEVKLVFLTVSSLGFFLSSWPREARGNQRFSAWENMYQDPADILTACSHSASAFLLPLTLLCAALFLQVQGAEVLQGAAPDIHHIYLRERGPVGDPALSSQRGQPHADPPAEGNHPRG